MRTRSIATRVPLLFGTVLLLITFHGKLWYTSDSHLYLEGAAYLSDNAFANLFLHPAFQSKPILFSLILMPFREHPEYYGWLQVIIYITTLWLCDKLAGKYLRSSGLLWFFNAMMATSTVLLMDHIFLWTESLFLLLLVIYALLLHKAYQRSEPLMQGLLILDALLICLLKHVGIFFVVPAGVLLLISKYRQRPIGKQIILPFLHLLIPVICFLGWQYMVWTVGGNQERIDHFSGADISSNYLLIANAMGNWFAPELIMKYISWMLVPVIFIFLFRSASQFQSKSESGVVRTIAWMMLFYFIILITKGDMIFSDDERYASVMFPFVLLVILTTIERRIEMFPKIKPLLFTAGGVIMLYNLIRVFKNASHWSDLI